MAGAGHVGVDPTVGPVGSPPHLGGTVNLKQKIGNTDLYYKR